jgi:predicted transcriptional regulator
MGQRRMRTIQIALAATLLLAGMLTQHPSVKALGPTYVSGEVHGIWDLEGSPYVVIEDAIVPELQNLEIQAGVEVRFDTNTGILVHGRIVAEGTEGDRVIFTPNNQTIKEPGQWKGIIISVFSTENVFEFSTIEYGTHGIRCAEESSVSIRNSIIRFNLLNGVGVVNSWASIKSTSITENNAGIRADGAEIEVIGSEVSSNTDYGMAFFLSGATIDSTQLSGNHDGMMVQGSEVHMTNSNVESMMNAMWLSDASLVTTLDTHFPTNAVVFDGITSTLIVQWTLKVRVLDRYSAGISGATVTVEGKLVDTMTFETNEEGWIEALVVREMVKTDTEEVIYNPYFVNATRSEHDDGVEAFINETKTLNIKLVVDVLAPDAIAGHDMIVDEDEAALFDAGSSVDDDPDFLTTGTFVWTIYDYDLHYMEAGITASHTFETPGTYSVKLRAEDAFGNWDVDYLEVHVTDITNPIAETVVPSKTDVHETIVLDASASTDNDPEFDVSGNYTWTIGTGSEVVLLYGETVEYAFKKGGTHPVQLVVRDAAGNSDIEIVDVEVLEEPEAIPYLPLAILALVGIAFVGAANTEAGKYWFLKFLILPLYVKLSKKDILDHFIRGQIYGYLVVHPGDNYTTIKRNLDLKNGTLTYHLDVLEREGFVKSQLRGSKRYYYPRGVKMPDNGTGFPAIKEDIIMRVQETPGITVSDLAGLLRVSRQLTNYHLRTLIQEGYIFTERKGMRTRCYPVEKRPDA